MKKFLILFLLMASIVYAQETITKVDEQTIKITRQEEHNITIQQLLRRKQYFQAELDKINAEILQAQTLGIKIPE